jgi:GNAT superfamily N-acetyltransferase
MSIVTMTPQVSLLDNIFWNALSGPHAKFAVGAGGARRYAPGFSPMLAFADPERPDFESIAPFCQAGEHFYTDGWSGPPPRGWQLELEATMCKMVWHGVLPATDEGLGAVPLGPEHAAQALDLATRMRPGPFGLRTLELGEYLGCFDDGRLVAMAGERLAAGTLREISGVCTDPTHQGRGLARRLSLALVRKQLLRNETPFLHVMSANETAHRLYGQMGFRDYRESVVRIVKRMAA